MLHMKLLRQELLERFARKHRDAATALQEWRTTAQLAQWNSIVEVRATYPSADGVAVRQGGYTVVATVFNIKGNTYRLITVINFDRQLVVIREFLTHAQYDKDSWKERL